ncbi:MAG: sel1 repeat family protein [Pontiellaceae bacterium]|nr:sel1 repeat family protein [Pontiellaceae bacterium]
MKMIIVVMFLMLLVSAVGAEVITTAELNEAYLEWEENVPRDSLEPFRTLVDAYCEQKKENAPGADERRQIHALVDSIRDHGAYLYEEQFKLLMHAPDKRYNPWLVELVETRDVNHHEIPGSSIYDVFDVLDLTIDEQTAFDLFMIALSYPETRSGEDTNWYLGNADIWGFLYMARMKRGIDMVKVLEQRRTDISPEITDEGFSRIIRPWQLLNEMVEWNETHENSALKDYLLDEEIESGAHLSRLLYYVTIDGPYDLITLTLFFQDLIGLGVVYDSPDERLKPEWWRSSYSSLNTAAEAVWRLGEVYAYGTEPDYDKAGRWLDLAVDMDQADALNIWGELYAQGIGVEKDEEKAVNCFYTAAQDLCATAEYNLGYCFEHGVGVEVDMSRAVEWYQKAVNLDHARAKYALGVCYELGRGVEKNLDEAIRLYKLASEQGIGEASFWLADLLYERYVDADEKAAPFEESAEASVW